MYDAGQLPPVQTGAISETQGSSGPPVQQQSGGNTADVSSLATTDNLDHKPQRRAALEHEVRFEDGPAVTKAQPTEPPATTSTTTEPQTEVPAALADVDQDILAMITEVMNSCKDQNYQAALDVIDSAIAAHRKMLEASERHHREQAPIQAARRQAAALRELQADIIQQQAIQKAGDQRRIEP